MATLAEAMVGIARVAKDIEDIGHVHSKASGLYGIEPIPEELVELPACIVWWRGYRITPGSHERQVHGVQFDIYFSRETTEIAYEQMLDFPDRVITAVERKGKAYGTVDSLLVVGSEDPEDVEWGGNPQAGIAGVPYIRLRVNLEAVIYRQANYKPE